MSAGMFPITVRPMMREDIPALVRMEREIFSLPWSERSFEELFQRDYNLCLTAEWEGHLAGCAVMTILGDEGDVDKVMVDEACRRKGIAQKLVSELLSEAKDRGVDCFTLEVRRSNLPAIRLYEKFGFVSEGIRPQFYEKPTEDALIMWRRPTITRPTSESL